MFGRTDHRTIPRLCKLITCSELTYSVLEICMSPKRLFLKDEFSYNFSSRKLLGFIIIFKNCVNLQNKKESTRLNVFHENHKFSLGELC
jgi:hypothetical protein